MRGVKDVHIFLIELPAQTPHDFVRVCFCLDPGERNDALRPSQGPKQMKQTNIQVTSASG